MRFSKESRMSIPPAAYPRRREGPTEGLRGMVGYRATSLRCRLGAPRERGDRGRPHRSRPLINRSGPQPGGLGLTAARRDP